jgi:type I restriction enzyme M protein
LRDDGLTEGHERFSEFCSILFLKILSEQEEKERKDKRRSENKVIPYKLQWESFQNKQGEDLLDYVNNALNCRQHKKDKFCCFQSKYGEDIFQRLQINNPATLKRIIDKLTPLQLISIDIDVKGEAFEYFLKEAIKGQKKDLGQYFTPRHIVNFLVKLADPKPHETVYDPFCGTGGILIKVFNYIAKKIPKNDARKWRNLKERIVWGNEITSTSRVAKMNMILTGDGHNNIQKINSLKSPASNQYDVIITNMPFSLKGPFDEYKDNYYLGKANGNSLCIEHCLDATKKDYAERRIVLITMEGILHDRKYASLREHIYQNWYIEYIISLPSFAFKPYANSNAVIFYLTAPKEREQKEVWHFAVKNDGFTENKREEKPGENDFDIFWKFKDQSEEEKLKNGFQKLEIAEIKKNHYISIPGLYKKFDFEESKYKTIPLSELIEEVVILRKDADFPLWSVTKQDNFVSQEARFKERVAAKDTSDYKLVPPRHFAYRPPGVNVGYICYNSKEMTGCITAYYPVFKVKGEAEIKPEYLFAVCQSEQFREQAEAFFRGTARPSINFTDFCKIKVPVSSLEEQEKVIEELSKIKENIKNTQKTIDNLNSRLSFSLSAVRKRLKNWEKLPSFNMGTMTAKPKIEENTDWLELRI